MGVIRRVVPNVALVVAAASIFMSAVLFSRIQDEREANIRANCLSVNDRQDETKARLNDLIAELPPARRARAEANVRGTFFLIEALAPKRDCEAVVRRQVRTP